MNRSLKNTLIGAFAAINALAFVSGVAGGYDDAYNHRGPGRFIGHRVNHTPADVWLGVKAQETFHHAGVPFTQSEKAVRAAFNVEDIVGFFGLGYGQAVGANLAVPQHFVIGYHPK